MIFYGLGGVLGEKSLLLAYDGKYLVKNYGCNLWKFFIYIGWIIIFFLCMTWNEWDFLDPPDPLLDLSRGNGCTVLI